uniref:GTD-binding domain-containing protein n=1 Tax=Setaria italica TaxID=4555 RepID=K3ZL20_SETIT
MDPDSAAASSAPTWRRAVRRRALEGAQEPELGRRAEELEEAVGRLRAEKEAAERAAAALRAELDAERGAAETAVSEAMLMIARLQSEKAVALIEAREFRRLAEGRAGRDRELQDDLAAVSALAASYAALLRAHGVDPEDEEDGGNYDDEEEHSVEHLEAEAEADGESRDSDVETKCAVVEIEKASPSPPPPTAEKEFEYTMDVRCTATTNAVVTAAGEERAVDIAGGLGLYARVEALEADRAAVRREVAALRSERAHVVLARRLWLKAASARSVAMAAERPRFSVLAICKEKRKSYQFAAFSSSRNVVLFLK